MASPRACPVPAALAGVIALSVAGVATPAVAQEVAQEGVPGLPGLPAQASREACDELRSVYLAAAARLRDDAAVQEFRAEVEYRRLRQSGVPEIDARYQAERLAQQQPGELRARANRIEAAGRQLHRACLRRIGVDP